MATNLPHLGVAVDGDQRVVFHPHDEGFHLHTDVPAVERVAQAAGYAAQLVILLHNVDGEALLRQRQRCRHAGDSPAQH